MHPTTTQYLLADPTIYPTLQTFMEAAGSPVVPLSFPTVYGVRDGVILGLLGTVEAPGAIVCGPLVVDPTLHHPALVGVRLIEAYEAVLAAAGVHTYLFGIDAPNVKYKALVEKRGFVPYAVNDDASWYIKEIV